MPDTGPLRPAPGHGPIFIVSAMGSGSTLLRLILDSHDGIAIPQETGFMRAYNAHQFVPLKWSGRNWAKRMGWSRKELDEELAHFYDRIFMRYAEQHGKRRWGDKTPLHTWHVDGMARLFPDAAFIGTIRHPGGSVASNMNRFNHRFSRAATHVERYDREITRQAARHADRFVLVRYEDLVLRTEPLLRELLEWLGEQWSDRVLEHHSVQVGRGGKLMVEGRNRIDDPIDVSRIAKWQATIPAAKRPALRRRMGRLAEFYGYAIDDPAVLEPLRSDGALLIGGRDIDARIDGFPDLNLRADPDPPLADTFYHPGRMQLYRVDEPPPRARAVRPRRQPPPETLVRIWGTLPPPARRRLRPLARRGLRTMRRLRQRMAAG